MAGGEQEFRAKHSNKAAKIDRDPFIKPVPRRSFWAEVEVWPDPEIKDTADRACRRRPYLGPPARLRTEERVGRAQDSETLSDILGNQHVGVSMDSDEVLIVLNTIAANKDRTAALASFHAKFSQHRLGPSSADKKQTRVFAFRNQASPSDPAKLGDAEETIRKLCIPEIRVENSLVFAFCPAPDDLVHQPTCFDAGVGFLEDFEPGGKTAGGMDEVITTPPLGRYVTSAPYYATRKKG